MTLSKDYPVTIKEIWHDHLGYAAEYRYVFDFEAIISDDKVSVAGLLTRLCYKDDSDSVTINAYSLCDESGQCPANIPTQKEIIDFITEVFYQHKNA